MFILVSSDTGKFTRGSQNVYSRRKRCFIVIARKGPWLTFQQDNTGTSAFSINLTFGDRLPPVHKHGRSYAPQSGRSCRRTSPNRPRTKFQLRLSTSAAANPFREQSSTGEQIHPTGVRQAEKSRLLRGSTFKPRPTWETSGVGSSRRRMLPVTSI